jgi:hypothetical protein
MSQERSPFFSCHQQLSVSWGITLLQHHSHMSPVRRLSDLEMDYRHNLLVPSVIYVRIIVRVGYLSMRNLLQNLSMMKYLLDVKDSMRDTTLKFQEYF